MNILPCGVAAVGSLLWGALKILPSACLSVKIKLLLSTDLQKHSHNLFFAIIVFHNLTRTSAIISRDNAEYTRGLCSEQSQQQMECNITWVWMSPQKLHVRACVYVLEMHAGFCIYRYVNYYYFLLLKNYWRKCKGDYFVPHFMSGWVRHQSQCSALCVFLYKRVCLYLLLTRGTCAPMLVHRRFILLFVEAFSSASFHLTHQDCRM